MLGCVCWQERGYIEEGVSYFSTTLVQIQIYMNTNTNTNMYKCKFICVWIDTNTYTYKLYAYKNVQIQIQIQSFTKAGNKQYWGESFLFLHHTKTKFFIQFFLDFLPVLKSQSFSSVFSWSFSRNPTWKRGDTNTNTWFSFYLSLGFFVPSRVFQPVFSRDPTWKRGNEGATRRQSGKNPLIASFDVHLINHQWLNEKREEEDPTDYPLICFPMHRFPLPRKLQEFARKRGKLKSQRFQRFDFKRSFVWI